MSYTNKSEETKNLTIENDKDVVHIDDIPQNHPTAEIINLSNIFNPPETSAIIILNQEFDITFKLFTKIWENYKLKICADGGANRLFEFLTKEQNITTSIDTVLVEKYLPNFIIGDLDSLKPEIADFYSRHKVKIIQQKTQYSSDLTKSLHLCYTYFLSLSSKDDPLDQIFQGDRSNNYGVELEKGIHTLFKKHMNQNNIFSRCQIVCINGIGGRFDQTIQSIHHLYDNYHCKNGELLFITKADIIFSIAGHDDGGCFLQYDSTFFQNCGSCGILPIGKPTTINLTKGLKWDVVNWDTDIGTGGSVSTSNYFVNDCGIYIDCKDDLIMSIEYNWS
ncbi:related to Thiamine pyrophosphokinase [Saccharomycodes ludwigii]|uniref:Thiamine pyrophosphokinase n=1 Tax=Saccharomycodes ludwigii TaxID=36035 RepID=A0A376BB86_9ASCO|nr:related to Thiamine pyrophosphokinase [Saccharomycodes ludwigii]